MENQDHIDELIVKSLLNELDQEEDARLATWLNAGEPNRKYYEVMKKAWQLTGIQQTAASIQAEQEWARFRQSVQEPVVDMRVRRYRKIGSLAIAASVLFLIGFVWYRYSVQKPVIPYHEPVVMKKTKAPGGIVNETVNNSGVYGLPDGTVVWLSDNSELSWQDPFTNDRRDVHLKGMARFEVAKDSTKPFTVLGSKLAVTALGTVFSVNNFDSARTIVVRLYEGKVVVRSAFTKDIYLLPGQELVFDNKKNTAIVQRFTKDNNKALQPVEELPLPYNDRGNWYMFNNQSLAQVFDQLKQIYDVEISYNEQDLQKMYFIGKFSKSDSIETILRQIAALNHLTVVKENNAFVISK